MRIYFYPECNFNINKAKTYDVTSLAEWFDSQHKNPDDYEIVGRDGESHDSAYEADVCAVYPKIMGGKSKGKNILKAVIGLGLLLATGGTTAALFAHYGGINMAHALGAGLLLSGGGALLMGKMKMPSMDLSSDSATKENYQWNVGNLSTSRGVKGVTFGSDVIPEGELLAYRTYGTSTLEKLTRSETYYVNETYKTGRQVWDYASYSYVAQTATRKVAKTRTVDDFYLVKDDSSYLELLIGAGEGELDSITDIRINDISLSDLEMVEDVDYAIRLGSNTQTALKQTNLDSQAGYQSIGQTVPVKLNGSVTPLLITTPSDCDSCCIAFQAQNWYLYDTSSGAKNKAYIKPKIGYRLNGSTGAYTYIKTGVKEIDSGLPIKSDSAFYFQTVIKFPSNGTYQISIENDSAELNNTKGLLSAAEYSGSALPDRAAINISVDNIACYNNKEQTYPNTALIWLRIPASQTLNGSMPKVTWKQTRASIYAYNGSSYVAKPADNLAWAIYDIIAQVRKDGNTYHNEGEDVANIDFDKFVAFATFCDSIGAKGNWFLNKLDTSWSNAMSVATSCRAFIGLRSGKVCPYWDAPTEMTQIFTVGNYEDMSGVITAKKDRAKAIEATFNNEEEKFASRTVRVEIDNDHSAEAVSMTFVGLSNPVNVSKQAHYILRRNKYLVQSVKFTADIDSIVCELNDVIGIQCDLTEYGVGGRIFKVENNVISLDAPVTLTSGNSYALLVRHTDGTLERKTPVETNGTFTQLTFNSAWSKPVLKGDVYSFGIANSEVRKYRVTGITRTNDLKAQIEAIEYNENVYDELAVAPYTYTNPNAGINNVTTTYTPEAVELAWDANNNTSYVNVYVDGVFYGRYQNGAQIPNINSEQLIEMFPVNEYGEEDTPVVRTISNNLPTPSTPPVPIVQSTTTGCVAEFDGIPKNENIVWLIIKEGDNELGRANILGEYMSVSIQLRSGTHTLSAYFVNQFSKSSQARTFTATPLGDIQANDISATALKLPTGSILRLSAKNCTTASIAEVNGVKDVSGRGNHGRAYGGISVVQDTEMGDCFSSNTENTYIAINSNIYPLLSNVSQITFACRVKLSSFVSQQTKTLLIFAAEANGSTRLSLSILTNGKIEFGGRRIAGETMKVATSQQALSTDVCYTIVGVADFSTKKLKIYLNGEEISTDGVELNSSGVFSQPSLVQLMGFVYPNVTPYKFSGYLSDARIYPRALSASEIKTLYMFPDDVTFGQLTADLIGANVIKAQNLIMTENVISNAAQINNAVFQSLIVTNGSTVANQVSVGGRNLVKNTSSSFVINRTSATNNYNFFGPNMDTTAYFLQTANTTDDYTISFDYSVTGITTARYLRLCLRETSSSYGNFTKYVEFTCPVGDSSGHVSITTKLTSGMVTYGTRFLMNNFGANLNNNVTVTITNMKMEKGNKATTWTPAPEDVDADSTAKANAVKNGLGTNGYTSIHGGNIMTDTITANAIAANAITAEKLSVTTRRPNNCFVLLSARGNQESGDGAVVPDLSGFSNDFKMQNAVTISSSPTASGEDWTFGFTTTNGQRILSKSSVSIPASFTAWIRVWITTTIGSGGSALFDMGISTGGNNRFMIYLNTSGYLCVYSRSNSGTLTEIATDIKPATGWNDIFVNVTTTSIGLIVCRRGYANVVKKTITVSTRAAFTATVVSVGGNVANTSNFGYYGYLQTFQLYGKNLTEDEIIWLSKNWINTESGQITADRIAAGSVETRHLTADAIVGKTFQTASNTGTSNAAGVRFNSSGIQGFNGSAKKFDLSTNGKLTCSDVDLTGKITATSGSFGSCKIDTTDSENKNCSMYLTSSKYKAFCIEATGDFIQWLNGSQRGVVIMANPAGVGESLLVKNSSNASRGGFGCRIESSGGDALIVKYSGTDTSASALYVTGKAYCSAGVWSGCDENLKKDIKDVSTLDKLKSIRVKKFKYSEKKVFLKDWVKDKKNEIKYNVSLLDRKTMPEPPEDNENSPEFIMAMAGEFNKAFGVDNGNEEEINYTNAIGVCMRAIQELAEQFDNAVLEIKELKAKLKIQQDKKLDVEQKEPTSKENLQVENDDTEPITEPVGNSEQLKDGGESEEKK